MGTTGNVRVAGEAHDAEDAFLAVVGYAFATRPLAWRAPTGGVGDAPTTAGVGRWAYATYDCVTAASGTGLSGVDLFIAAGLNGRLDNVGIASLLAVEPEVSGALAAIPADTTFWGLPADAVAAAGAGGEVPASSPLRPMLRAWTAFMGAPGLDVAITHKTLHHKRPRVFPLLDGRTAMAYPAGEAWASIHDDLNADPDAWEQLERRFAGEAAQRGGVPLTRLRMHDIVLWLRLSGGLDEAIAPARALLRG
jgi:Family of unknown function (DUF6308)